jgi:hypothetical protein
MPVRIRAWSASRVFQYETCPRQLAYSQDKSIPRREPEPGTPLAEGKRIHGEGEAYLRGTARKVPPFYRYFREELRHLRRQKAVPEQQWAFTEAWEPCEWFAPETWCRMVVDALVLRRQSVRVVDYKTGGAYPKDEDQLDLYALGAFATFPQVKKVRAELWYLKLDQDVVIDYTRADEPRLRAAWEGRARPMLEATEFPTRPNPGRWPCKHCDFSRDQGGPCRDG